MQGELVRQEAGRIWSGLRSVAIDPALLALAPLTGLGLLLRLLGMGQRSIWLDEAFSIAISQRSASEIVRLVVLTDAHPPLYYLLLNLWMRFGVGHAHIRLLSALFGAAGIVVMFFLGQALFGERRAGVAVAAILAFSPFHIWYSQEARMYAPLVFFVLASAYFFVRAVQSNRAPAWVGFALAGALAAYADYAALWFLGALGLFYLFARARFPGTGWGWILSHVGVALLYSPWLPSFVSQTRKVTESFWLQPPSFHTVLGTFLDFHSMNFPVLEISVAYMAAALVLAYIVPEESGWQRSFATALLIVPILLSLLVSLRQPIFLSRNLIPASLGYYLLLTGVVQRFKSNRAALFVLAPLLIANMASVAVNSRSPGRENWRAAAAYVQGITENFDDGLMVFIPAYAELPFRHHYEPAGEPIPARGYPSDEILLHSDPQSMEDIPSVLRGQPRVWLILRDVEAADPEWQVKQWLDESGYIRLRDRAFGDIRVITYFHWSRVFPMPRQTINLLQVARHCQDERGIVDEACRAAVFGYELYDPNVRYHRVNPGETLSWLALRYGSTVDAIMEANGLKDRNRIYVGDELVIPLVSMGAE